MSETINPFIIADNSNNREFKILDAGSYPARCISVIDLGTQTIAFNNEIKSLRKIRITFEFPTELSIFKEENGEQPFILSTEFTYSLHEKGRLRPFLESWRGRKFTEEELKGFDVSKLLDVTCLASVGHYTRSKDGKDSAEITSVGLMPKGMTCPDAINPLILFSPYSFDKETFDSLPEFLQEKIKKSSEIQARMKISLDLGEEWK